MWIQSASLHLSYCTNIHAAESWQESFASLKKHTIKVRNLLVEQQQLKPDEAFGIGLRLSAQAASELKQNRLEIDKFRSWLIEEHCYLYTINGFPFGQFHGTRVKEQVYAPDWTHAIRLQYTQTLFELLLELAPNNIPLSVSTLPGSLKSFMASEVQIINNLCQMATWLEMLSQTHQRDLSLGLEPEPFGYFENTEESINFFHLLRHSHSAPSSILQHVGINYDACHFALQFESPHEAIKAFKAEGIRISKVHASNALSLDPRNALALEHLKAFDESTYLHQVIAQNFDGSLMRICDLTELWSHQDWSRWIQAKEWRVHFHLPLHAEKHSTLGNTISHLNELITLHQRGEFICEHWEIETYTWAVLPTNLQVPLVEQICREYQWIIPKLKTNSEKLISRKDL